MNEWNEKSDTIFVFFQAIVLSLVIMFERYLAPVLLLWREQYRSFEYIIRGVSQVCVGGGG